MRARYIFLAAAVLGLSLAQQAEAVIVHLGGMVESDPTHQLLVAYENQGAATWPTGVPPVLNGFTAYRLRLVSTDPSKKIAGIDLNGTPSRGIFGPLHQRWYDSDDGEPVIKSVFSLWENNANSLSNDSHFLFNLSMLGTAGEQDEDNPGTGSPRPNGPLPGIVWGVGTYLRGAFTILGAGNQVSDLPFAYIVLPDGRESEFHGEMDVALTPEPGMLGLMLLGAGLRRRI